MRVASRVAERLRTSDLSKLGNFKYGWTYSLVPCLPSESYTLVAVKKHAKIDTNLLFSISPFCSKYLVQECRF